MQPLGPRKVAITLADRKIVQDSRDSWADVFDLLRSKQPRCICLMDPQGKEFDGPFVSLNTHSQESHWLSTLDKISFFLVGLGEQYIGGSHNINHFREQKDSRLYAQGPGASFGVHIETGSIESGIISFT